MNKLFIQFIPLACVVCLFTGCAAVTRTATDVGLGAGGAALGGELSHNNPMAIVAGAAGGALLGEGLHAANGKLNDRSYHQAFPFHQCESPQNRDCRMRLPILVQIVFDLCWNPANPERQNLLCASLSGAPTAEAILNPPAVNQRHLIRLSATFCPERRRNYFAGRFPSVVRLHRSTPG
jgi:hypothetical protein